MRTAQMLAKALNIALAELREVSEVERLNSFDSVMRHFNADVRQHIKVDMSPVYWDDNDYDQEYADHIARYRRL